jgi:RimJ/RimL family protein N-acetyltransferase
MSLVASPLNIVMPITLEGSVVRLEPIRREHAEVFWDVAKDALGNIFEWIPYRMKTREDFQRLVEKAFDEQERGESVVFATVERRSGQVIGSTRFMNIDRANRRVEIGSTWIAPAWQRTAVNTEAKYLMLRHAFEVWNCFRVELKTDGLNQRSRNAILRIGAKEEGTLRKTLDHLDRPRARHGLLQHSGYGVAGSEIRPGTENTLSIKRVPALARFLPKGGDFHSLVLFFATPAATSAMPYR